MVDRSRKLNRADWLREALSALDSDGLIGVKIQRLSASLDVSRGSFYWHFRDLADLLQSVLDYWESEFTTAVIARASAAEGDARDLFFSLMEDVLERRQGRFEPAVRAWARHDDAAAKVVRRVDRKRLAFITSLFLDMGFSREEADARSRMALLYLVGDHVVLANEPASQRRKLLRLRHRVLTEHRRAASSNRKKGSARSEESESRERRAES